MTHQDEIEARDSACEYWYQRGLEEGRNGRLFTKLNITEKVNVPAEIVKQIKNEVYDDLGEWVSHNALTMQDYSGKLNEYVNVQLLSTAIMEKKKYNN